MKKIYKYQLEKPGTITEIEMPVAATVLDVQIQDDKPVMWAMIHNEDNIVKRKFLTVGTGDEIKHHLKPTNYYLGTYQIYGEVYHVLEIY